MKEETHNKHAYGNGRINAIDEILEWTGKKITFYKKRSENPINSHHKAQVGGKIKAYVDLRDYLRQKMRNTIR